MIRIEIGGIRIRSQVQINRSSSPDVQTDAWGRGKKTDSETDSE